MATNDKITLAELRKEASRVFGRGYGCYDMNGGCAVWHKSSWTTVLALNIPMLTGSAHRRRMLQLLRALPDGAMR